MKKNIMVTGAAGFIGFHLAKRLHERGDRVVGYDNFNDYYNPQLKRARAKQLKQLGVEIVEGDLNEKAKLSHAIYQHQTSHLVHLAAQAGVRYSLVNPRAYVDSNITGFLNVLECCREGPIKLIYASSSSVYGLNSKVPFAVEDPTEKQASLYGVTKKTNELMASTYHHLYKIPVIGLRYFTVYGPWGRPDMAYFSFAKAISEDKPIELFNHGNMERDFTYIDDIIDGTVAAIDREATCEIFNLGNHRPEPLIKLVQLLEQYLNKKAKTLMVPMQQGDVIATYADIHASQEKLGFYPKTSLDMGIKKFIEWYESFAINR